MAKVQKTFYLNAELERVVDSVSETTGASFTKIVTAALIRYLLGEGGSGPDPAWMRLAVNLERGDISLADVPVRAAEHNLAKTIETLGMKRDDPTWSDADRALRLNQFALRMAEHDLSNWRGMQSHAEMATDDPLTNILRALSGIRRAGVAFDDPPPDNAD